MKPPPKMNQCPSCKRDDVAPLTPADFPADAYGRVIEALTAGPIYGCQCGCRWQVLRRTPKAPFTSLGAPNRHARRAQAAAPTKPTHNINRHKKR